MFFLQKWSRRGVGDVDLVEMRTFHTSASFSLQMNQIKTSILLSLQMNQTKTFASFSLQHQKKTRENKNKKANISSLWPYGYPLAPHSLWSLFFVFLGFLKFFLFLTKSGSCLGHLLVCWRFFSQNSFKILTFTTPPPIATSSLFFGWVGLSYTFRLQFAKGASQQLRRKQPQPWNDSDALRDAALGNYGGNVTRLSEWPSAPSSGQVQVRKIMRRISTGWFDWLTDWLTVMKMKKMMIVLFRAGSVAYVFLCARESFPFWPTLSYLHLWRHPLMKKETLVQTFDEVLEGFIDILLTLVGWMQEMNETGSRQIVATCSEQAWYGLDFFEISKPSSLN